MEKNEAARLARRAEVLQDIRRVIEKHGIFIYGIQQGMCPRYFYTIGLREKRGFELFFPGGVMFYVEDCHALMNAVAKLLIADASRRHFSHEKSGSITLRPAHRSWADELTLGAFDYYDCNDIEALQIVPLDQLNRTIDTPDCTIPLTAEAHPIWQWEFRGWDLPVSTNAHVAVDLHVLRGAAVLKATRWEHDYWELFSGLEEGAGDFRILPIGTVIGHDPSLQRILTLGIEEGVYRESRAGEWNDWE